MAKPVNDVKSKLQTNSPHEQSYKSGILQDPHTIHVKKKKKPECITFLT